MEVREGVMSGGEVRCDEWVREGVIRGGEGRCDEWR